MKTINIPIKDNSYNVYIKRGLLLNIDSYIDLNREIVIITDDFIPKTYLNTIKEKMSNLEIFEIPHGENSKSMEVAYSIFYHEKVVSDDLVIQDTDKVIARIVNAVVGQEGYNEAVDLVESITIWLSNGLTVRRSITSRPMPCDSNTAAASKAL